ncbi:hypothetical protein SLEP1_g50187 [Rubroshorea leprosula]|uniref:t-SNARE coiled-coil homology domain-containing protein n=1 Tax=Rubroshorea leprosula TaxID=152421 RepID=A0AAV5M2J3_9ROSI|nr:hypothetical protein SLEP1_g50187 [Rubroshorea leprosula]
MNDLMTKSFLSYVELKKQALKDLESDEPDIEMGQLHPTDEENLSKFFDEVMIIKNDMEEITNLVHDLQGLNEESKSTHSAKVLRGIRDRIQSDMITILQKAKNIKSRLESLDHSNIENRKLAISYKEGTPIDRTRMSTTNGLRVKLREMMWDFQSLREQIVKSHKEGLKRQYYNVTGVEPSQEMIESLLFGGGEDKVFEGKADLVMENRERHEALKEIHRSLTELHHVFLDMAVLVETQGELINDIKENVAKGGVYISGGTNALFYANQMKNRRRNCASWIGGFVLVLLLICIISILAS